MIDSERDPGVGNPFMGQWKNCFCGKATVVHPLEQAERVRQRSS